MKVYLDCYPCFIRQALDAARFASDEPEIQESVLKAVFAEVVEFDMSSPAPLAARQIHRIVREITGLADPYAEVKQLCNSMALDIFDKMKELVDASAVPLETAVRLAVAGNVIDFGVKSEIGVSDISSTVKEFLSCTLPEGVMDAFEEEIKSADSILYLTDNAGEIVFDRLLIELLPREKTVAAVRGFPSINDATIQDARIAGLTDIVEVIDNGSDAPATLLSDCSESFIETFNRADLIISKGQGNYETLSDIDKNIFFLLKAKCPVIAGHIGCEVGEMVFRQNNNYSGLACSRR